MSLTLRGKLATAADAASGVPIGMSGSIAATTPHFAAAAAGAGGAHPSLMGGNHQISHFGGTAPILQAEDAVRTFGVGSATTGEAVITATGNGGAAAQSGRVSHSEPPTESVILGPPLRSGSLPMHGLLLVPSADGSNAGSHDQDNEGDEGPDECCAVHGEHLGICGWNWHHWAVFWARTVAYNAWFEGFIVLCIVLSGALVGVQLYPAAREPNVATVLGIMDLGIVVIFTVEVLIKLIAEGASIIEFFRSPSNNLDFFIVVISFVPFENNGDTVGTATLIRTIRLLRLLKLVKSVPQLRVLVMGVAESVSAIGYIFALLLLLIFIYGVAGNSWFAENDPFNFGTLDQSMVTVFRAGERPQDVSFTRQVTFTEPMGYIMCIVDRMQCFQTNPDCL